MGCGYIQVADGVIGAGINAFLAAFARLCMIDTGVPVLENNDFSKDAVGACLHAFPAGLAPAGVDFDKFRAQMFRKGGAQWSCHCCFSLLCGVWMPGCIRGLRFWGIRRQSFITRLTCG
jgi:hypothetical protein